MFCSRHWCLSSATHVQYHKVNLNSDNKKNITCQIFITNQVTSSGLVWHSTAADGLLQGGDCTNWNRDEGRYHLSHLNNYLLGAAAPRGGGSTKTTEVGTVQSPPSNNGRVQVELGVCSTCSGGVGVCVPQLFAIGWENHQNIWIC